MKAELMDGVPGRFVSASHPSGWLQMDIVTMWCGHC
jgi:hypothetical protein